MASSVDAFAVLRLSEKAMPTTENSRSTVADEAGQPRYCLAIRARFGKRLQCEGREMQQALSSYASQPLGLPLLATLVDRLLRRGRSLGRGLGLLAHHEPSGGREAEELWTALGILRQRKLLLNPFFLQSRRGIKKTEIKGPDRFLSPPPRARCFS